MRVTSWTWGNRQTAGYAEENGHEVSLRRDRCWGSKSEREIKIIRLMVSTQQSLKDHGEVFLENKIYHCREALRANGSADGKPLSSSISQGERGEQSEVLADRMCIYQTQPAGESYITSIPVSCLGPRHPPEHCFGLLWPDTSRQGSVRLTSWWERQVLGARLLGI